VTNIHVYAEISGIEYKPLLCRELKTFSFDKLDQALQEEPSFKLKIDESEIAVSWWVSPKRTRSYPYARVYDTLCFTGKKVTIIPIMKDEGKDGDRDFLQWDSVSLMNLLGVYVIISYYADASKNPRYRNKITNQKFDIAHVKSEIEKLLYYHSDALHWNLDQLKNIGNIGRLALQHYRKISEQLGVEMHSWKYAEKRIRKISEDIKVFMKLSRQLAEKAQKRESVTKQPKENLTGIKATLTISNYLGGKYYFTCDEVEIHGDELYLIEGKHSSKRELPSLEDIKDGLLKMILYTNLVNVTINGKTYNPVPILKLTTAKTLNNLQGENLEIINLLKQEAETNNFKILINNEFII
jgi:hypothetical protein